MEIWGSMGEHVIMRDLGKPPNMAQRNSCNRVNSIVVGSICLSAAEVTPDNRRAHPGNEKGEEAGEEKAKKGSAMQPEEEGEGMGEERKEGSAMQPQEKEGIVREERLRREKEEKGALR